MTNYEVVVAPIVTARDEVQGFEKWLERISSKGGDLVCFVPTSRSDILLAVFRVASRGTLSDLKDEN